MFFCDYPIIRTEKDLPLFLLNMGQHDCQDHIIRTEGYPCPQILYCTKGGGTLIIDENKIHISPCTVIYMPALYPHEYYPDNDVWDIHWVVPAGYASGQILEHFGLIKPLIYELVELKTLDRIFRKMHESIRADSVFGNYRASGYLYDFLIEFYRLISENKASQAPNSALMKALDYINENYTSAVSMDDLCYFSLVMFASTEICYLNRFLYEFNCSSSREESHYKKKLYDGLDSVMEHEGLDCFVAFSKFCSKYYQDKTSDGSFKRTAHRAIKYGLLYTMFFLRFAINQKFNERKVVEAMTSLINLFGMSDREYLEKEYQPLIEKYNHVFEFRYIERTLRQLGFSI